jgi:hypothetical protein
MDPNPYESPTAPENALSPQPELATSALARRGRIIVGVVAIGILFWDFVFMARADNAVMFFIVDACALSFMWTGSRVTRFVCVLRCVFPGAVAIPVAIAGAEFGVAATATIVMVAGLSLIGLPSVRSFFAYQRARRRRMF